jgi:hypothetical protein
MSLRLVPSLNLNVTGEVLVGDNAPMSEAVGSPSSAERRENPRLPIKLQVTILTGCRSFTTYTSDISLGGLLLERPLPFEMCSDSFRMIIATPKGKQWIESKGRLPGGIRSPRRVAFREKNTQFEGKLNEWFRSLR